MNQLLRRILNKKNKSLSLEQKMNHRLIQYSKIMKKLKMARLKTNVRHLYLELNISYLFKMHRMIHWERLLQKKKANQRE